MSCSSCGQRYSAARTTAPLSSRILARQQLSLKRRKLMVNDPDTSPSAGIIQPEPLQGELAPVFAPVLDPSTGQEISVIKTGDCEGGSLGETTLAPIAADTDSDAQGDASSEEANE